MIQGLTNHIGLWLKANKSGIMAQWKLHDHIYISYI